LPEKESQKKLKNRTEPTDFFARGEAEFEEDSDDDEKRDVELDALDPARLVRVDVLDALDPARLVRVDVLDALDPARLVRVDVHAPLVEL